MNTTKRLFALALVGLVGLALPLLLLFGADAVSAAPGDKVEFTKTASNSTPRVNDVFTFTLSFRNVSSQTLQVKVTDLNPYPAYLQIISSTVTGGAVYSASVGNTQVEGITWSGTLAAGAGTLPGPWTVVTYQARVIGMPGGVPSYQLVSAAQMADLASPGSLPMMVAWNTITLLPAPSTSRVIFTKNASNLTPRVGQTVTFNLNFANVSAQALQVRVTDLNYYPAYLQILTSTVTGGAVYSASVGSTLREGIVWQGPLVVGTLPITVTYQAKVISMPTGVTSYPVTNYAQMIDLSTPGSLPLNTAWTTINLMSTWSVYLPLLAR
jgi:uncharacterized repeat protein (TIGR01451 family)